MIDWLYELPIFWMAVVVFSASYLIAAAIYKVVLALASGERARAFKAVSPGMLPHWVSSSVCWWPSSPRRCGAISIGQRSR